ncbi:MAG: DUF1800 domain-containing protein [Bacteroidota bacterium]
MITLNCATGTLSPYTPSADRPWNQQRVLHLYRRLGVGATPQEVQQALGQSPTALVDQLIDQAKNAAPLPEPFFADWTYSDYDPNLVNEQMDDHREQWMVEWLKDMANVPFRGKLTLFWSNHFVTRHEAYRCSSYMYKYYRVLEDHFMGDFKQFIYDIGLTPAMLIFLNGAENTRRAPNENYARELYELFSLGADNGYTQEDVVETSRALTGFVTRTESCGEFSFSLLDHDPLEKTIFGQMGNWGYDDVIRILFEERAEKISLFICEKLYRHFVSDEINENIISSLAVTFRNADFNLEPVYRQLFRSEHFFDDAIMQVKVKSPLDYSLSLTKELEIDLDDEKLLEQAYFGYVLGQLMFDPVDVAGWPGNRTWIDSNTLTLRWKVSQYYYFTQYNDQPEKLRAFAKLLSGNSKDPDFVTQSIIDFFIPKGLYSTVIYDRATIIFKADIPQNYYDDEIWDLDWEPVPGQVALLLDYLTRIPEFQTH